MKVLLWNCRGAGKPSFAPAFRRFVLQNRPEICILFETRLSGRSLQKARRVLPRSWGFYAVESRGLSGGIIVTWRLESCRLDPFHVCGQEVILVISEGTDDPWVLAAVYASTDFRERRRLWEEASQLVAQGFPFLMAGDFNCIVDPQEKMGGKPFSHERKVKEFEDFLTTNGLIDLGFTGPRFTWCNNQQGPARVWERLDRACATAGWVQRFPDHRVREDMALLPSFMEDGQGGVEHSSEGDAMYRVSRRLELARRRLRRWNREEVGDIFRRIEESEEAITAGDFWRQKARVQWIMEGDRNTRYFHQATVIRRNQNRIRFIRDEKGQQSEEPEVIQRILVSFFRSRWTEQTGVASLADIPPPGELVTEVENSDLIRPVSEREIREAVWSLGGDKAPGPDGFPPVFFQRYWMIVGRDVTAAIQQFFSTAVIAAEWQRTFIALIPKRQDATEPSHFRPISLCTTLYKVTTKILAIRLRGVLPRLISPEQGAFLEGRSISDNVLIAQEFMFDLSRAPMRRSLMGVKLDMERAYDRMRWDFVQQSLRLFGVHETWIRWAMSCIRGPSFALLVNGSPSRFFSSSGGLRQGCPLSPLLFIICADALSRFLRQAVMSQELEAYRPVEGAVAISHLLFADDCMLLARSTRQSARVIDQILRDYCALSGQQVNLDKSAVIFSPKTRGALKRSILEVLGVGEQGGMMSYLGVPLCGRRLRIRDCVSLVTSVRRRLEGWQSHSLSMMGRIVLVRSVLSSVPIYLLSHVDIPVSVLRSLEQLFREFIWGRRSGRGGIHLVAWESVCQPTSAGGLGVQSLMTRREVLAARHVARFVLEPESMWSSLMRAKYGVLVPGGRMERHLSPTWRVMCARAMVVLSEIRWVIGDGHSIDVLEDSWVTDWPICRLPTMVDSARLAGCRVRDLLDSEGSHWRVGLIREVFGEQLAEMILALPIPSGGVSDRLLWTPTGQSRVRARDLCALFCRTPARQIEGGWIWRLRIHPRVALFIWKVAWGCLPTRSLLVRRGMEVSQFCETCGDIVETIEHVLLLCPRARQIWQCSSVPLIDAVVSTQDLLRMLRDSMSRPRLAAEGILRAYLSYHIWLDRNAGIFEGRRGLPRMVVDRAARHAREVMVAATEFSSGMARDIWGSPFAVSAPLFVTVSWVPPPLGYLKVNFDGSKSLDGLTGGVGFVIRDHGGRLVAAGGRRTPGITVVGAELRAAWEGLSYARQVLGVERVFLEGDSAVVIDWIRGRTGTATVTPSFGRLGGWLRRWSVSRLVMCLERRTGPQIGSPLLWPGIPGMFCGRLL
ncbi:uncharacterized protein LOC120106025 [Phoenix dactylifera]|uniref:Uncharacterized protein LOC120106025 n=1 Tax=Phoenix dactylifera TaxID=42345 RepID=A0A8B8ZKT6_PHODC|nr:uncharacterized protein LOC120106025 [Phoenix dactylifera]